MVGVKVISKSIWLVQKRAESIFQYHLQVKIHLPVAKLQPYCCSWYHHLTDPKGFVWAFFKAIFLFKGWFKIWWEYFHDHKKIILVFLWTSNYVSYGKCGSAFKLSWSPSWSLLSVLNRDTLLNERIHRSCPVSQRSGRTPSMKIDGNSDNLHFQFSYGCFLVSLCRKKYSKATAN